MFSNTQNWSASGEVARHNVVNVMPNSDTPALAQGDVANQQLVERLLSHYDAGTSAREVAPAAKQLQAQISCIGLLSRNVQLPDGLLASAGAHQSSMPPRSQVLGTAQAFSVS